MFARLICKARTIRKRQLQLLQEKRTAYDESQKRLGKLTLHQKYIRTCLAIGKRLKKCCSFPKGTVLYRLCFNLKHEGTCENFTLKSILGFIGGFFLTYIFFMFFVLQLNFKLSTATIMCSFFGSILTIGLAFSYKVRCVVFLVLPQFFSKKGRQALLAYAFILAITGPAKNTLNNMSILGESLACGQEQLKSAVRQIIEVVKKPFYAIRDAIKAVVKVVKEIVKKIKEILLTIKRIILSIVKLIKSAFSFIAQIMNFCNKEFGTPFQRCQRVFEEAIVDCNAKLGPLFNWLCNITYLVKHVCYIVKILDYVCFIVDFIKDTVGSIVTKVKQFVRHIRTMFYVRIKFSHSYHFESNHTKSMSDITTGIVTEIKRRSSGMIKIFDFMSCAASLFFIFMVFKVIYYKHKFLSNEMYDNKFISKDFRRIDLRRAQMGLETVLPLNHRERQSFISLSSMRLVKKEKRQLSESAMILLMATLKLSLHMATDYSLYWIMTLIRYYGRFQSKIPPPNVPGIHIEGEGFLAALLGGIVKAFHPIGISLEIDTVPCLPDPIPPDYDRYIQIGTLLVLCWFLAIFEPYGLRFRHLVMCYYYPQRARERSIWLYNHILRSRSSFLKFARRQLRRKVKSDKTITKVTFMEFIRSKLARFPICHWVIGNIKQSSCLLCGEVFREGDGKVWIKCATPNCPGLYCEQCFNDLQNWCTVCLDPIQYGDLSDISEEKDSSDDKAKPVVIQKKKRKTKRRKKKKDSKKSESDDDDDEDDSTRIVINDEVNLLPLKEHTDVDSDYYSSSANQTDVSTDYSYSYQTQKNIAVAATAYDHKMPFVDLEKQNIPEQASMQDFKKLKHIRKPLDGYNSSSSDISEIEVSSLQHLNEDLLPIISAKKQNIPEHASTHDFKKWKQNRKPLDGYNSSSSDISEFEDSSLQHLNEDLLPKISPASNDDKTTSAHSEHYSTRSSTPFKGTSSEPKSGQSLQTNESIPLGFLNSDQSFKKRSVKLINLTPNTTETSFYTSPYGSTRSDFLRSNITIENRSKISKQILGRPNFVDLHESINMGYQSSGGSGQGYGIDISQYSNSQQPHPDVPRLNLDFVHEDSGNENRRSCHCRFKDVVKYSYVDETTPEASSSRQSESNNTNTTSSALSSSSRLRKKNYKQIKISPTENTTDREHQRTTNEGEYVEVNKSFESSPISRANKDANSTNSTPNRPYDSEDYAYDSIRSYTTSYVTDLVQSTYRREPIYDDLIDLNNDAPETTSSNERMGDDEQSSGDVSSRGVRKRNVVGGSLHQQRVRAYYRKMVSESFKNIPIEPYRPKKESSVRKFINFFRPNKKKRYD